jgi:nucleoside-diphosphate-sugar epimerase
LKAGVKVFLQASSEAAYSISAYGVSKLKAEHSLENMDVGGLSIIRICTLFGDKPSPKSLVADMVDSIKNKKPICVWGEGKRSYDVISTWDVAEVFVRILQKGLEGTYNLGSGLDIRVKDIAESLSRVSGSKIEYLPQKRERQGYLLDSSELLGEIDFNPASLDVGFKRMLESVNG